MFGSLRNLPNRPLLATLILAGALVLGACTEGEDPAALVGESRLSLAMDPGFLRELAPDEVRPIERIRVRAEEEPGGAFLGGTTFTVDPQAQEWTLDFSVAIPAASTVTVTLSVELISLSTGAELVDWSGRSGSLFLRVGTRTEVDDISLVKGPLANLAVLGVSIQEPIPALLEGQSTQIVAQATTSTPQDPPTLFWRTMDPLVATVSGSGVVQGVSPGTARIVATAGAAADTAAVSVLPRPASVAIEPQGAVLNALGEDVSFQAQVLDPRGNPVPDDVVTWTVANPGILQDLGGGSFRALSRGTTTVKASSSFDPGVFSSVEVVVQQVVAAVDVTPEEAVVFIGEGAQFQAVALDANENPIEGMSFSWSTSDPGLASVDGTGLAAGLDAGTASILAEAASGVMGAAGPGTLAPTPGTTGIGTLVVLPEVARVAVLPNPFTFRSLGQVRAFTARAYGLDEAGQPTILLPLTDFTWESLNETVMVVDSLGLTADTAFVRSVANGSTVLRATAHGVTGSTPVFVTQRVATVEVAPSPWTFVQAMTGGYEPRDFTARGYDALGNRVTGATFTWDTNNGECFPIANYTATQATVTAQCGCGWVGEIYALSGSVTGTAFVSTPLCATPSPECLASALPAGSLFRLGTSTF